MRNCIFIFLLVFVHFSIISSMQENSFLQQNNSKPDIKTEEKDSVTAKKLIEEKKINKENKNVDKIPNKKQKTSNDKLSKTEDKKAKKVGHKKSIKKYLNKKHSILDHIYEITPLKRLPEHGDVDKFRVDYLPALIRKLRYYKYQLDEATKKKKKRDFYKLNKKIKKITKIAIKVAKKICIGLKNILKKLEKEKNKSEAERVKNHLGHVERLIDLLIGKKWTKKQQIDEFRYIEEKLKIRLDRPGISNEYIKKIKARLENVAQEIKKLTN